MYKVIKYSELVTVIIERYFLRFLVSNKNVEDWENDPNTRAYIIVANHSSAFDPFIITSNLRWGDIKRLTPYFFMTHNRFFKTVLRPWLRLHGCFPAFQHPKLEYGLAKAEALLKDRHTVLIFPEGGVSRIERTRPVKRGISHLASIDGVKILPARIKWNRSKGIAKSYSLSIGKPFSGKHMTAEQIMDVVYSLKFR